MKLDGQLICIFGGGGFVGRYVAQQLLARGARVRIAERSVKNEMHIKPLGNLGQTQFASTDITQADSVHRAASGCDAVINLVGVFGSEMEKVNCDGARHIAEAALSAGCTTLIHVSAIGADASSPSKYGRCKAKGEQAVLGAFSRAIIVRPSIIFGQEDNFINRFAGMIQMLPIVPVIGATAKFQPVFVGDVASAIAEALEKSSDYAGKTIELGGPEIISMGDLNQRIAKMAGRDRGFVDVPNFAARLLATCTGFLPGAPITLDQFKMLKSDNVVAKGSIGLSDLGITPTPLAAVAPGWLDKYRAHGRFGATAKVG